jgi:hypothetical protein
MTEMLVAGTLLSKGVYRSTDNGTTWTQTTLNNKSIHSLTVLGNNILAGTEYYDGLYISTDNGVSWSLKNEGLTSVNGVYSLLIANNFIFAGTSNKSVYRRPLSEIISIQNISTEIPSTYSLQQNYPNPFNPSTKIKFDIPALGFPLGRGAGGMTVIRVYNILGKEIETLVNEKLNPGTYEVIFNASQYPSGVYFYRLISDGYNETKRMLLIK